MDIVGKLIKKEFTTDNGEVREYYVISIPLYGNETIEISLKGDKAKLILMSETMKRSNK